MSRPPAALIVAGPTASGKSALALALAQRLDGVVINADSMQVYAELRILTARPSPAEAAVVPHRLYGIRPAAQPGSAACWRTAALAAMDEARQAGRLPILCGGTGLYLLALTEGLSDIPDPGQAARDEARGLLARDGSAALYRRLEAADPATARRLRPSDSQRLARAWEVLAGTGRGLAEWYAQASEPAPWRFSCILLDPPRAELREAIARRLRTMLAAGALDEVRTLLALQLDPAVPAMRAQGVPELSAYLAGRLSLPDAIRRTELAGGQYAKRQSTWFRNRQLAETSRVHAFHARFTNLAQLSQSDWDSLENFLHGIG